MNKFSRSIAALITATALGVCTAAAAHAQPSAGDGDTVSGPQVLESGLTPEEAYAQSLAVLEASREELARSRSAGPLSRTFGAQTDAGMAASVSWPSYFSSSGLDAISCVIVVADLASCNTARNYAESALNLAAARYPSSVHNGKGDAFRHCYWSGLMTVGLGEGTAERIGGNHEAVSSNPVSEQNMDRYNNGRGRWVGVTYGTTFAADVRCTGLLSTAKAPRYCARMNAEGTDTRTAQSRALSVGLLVAGTSLVIVAIALRAAGGLGLSDSSTSPSDLLEIGRLSASRSMVSLLAAIGLCWIGYRGVTGATPHWITRRLLGLCLGILCVSVIQGLWLFAGLCALLAAVCGLLLRTSRG